VETTLDEIRKWSPCINGWTKLLANLGKQRADHEPLAIATILESNGLADAVWCLRAVQGHQSVIAQLAVDFAKLANTFVGSGRAAVVIDSLEQRIDDSNYRSKLHKLADCYLEEIPNISTAHVAERILWVCIQNAAREIPYEAAHLSRLQLTNLAIWYAANNSKDAQRAVAASNHQQFYLLALACNS
jgi:hypothetical protein